MSYIFPEKIRFVIIASDCFRQGDGHMEHMAHSPFALCAVAFPLRFDALTNQMFIHRLGVGFQKITMGSGNVCGRIICCDGIQDLQPGIGKVGFRTQIVPGKASFALCHGGRGVHTTVQAQGADGDLRHGHVEQGSVVGIRGDGGVLACQLCTGGVTYQDDAAGVQVIPDGVFTDPLHDRVGIPQGRGELPFGGQAVVEFTKAKPRRAISMP